MRNHLGTYECKLCLTLHNTEVREARVRAILNRVWLLNSVTSNCFMLPSLHCVHCNWGCQRVDSGNWTLSDANLLPTGACSGVWYSMGLPTGLSTELSIDAYVTWWWHAGSKECYRHVGNTVHIKFGTIQLPYSNSVYNTSLIHSVIYSDVSIFVIETYLSLFIFPHSIDNNAYTNSSITCPGARHTNCISNSAILSSTCDFVSLLGDL